MTVSRVALLACVPAALLQAQQGGFISGVVRDRSGTVVAGAEVRIQNDLTGARQKATADSAGTYSSSETAAGIYRITVRSDGFRTASRADIAVSAGKTSRVDFTIELLHLQQEVTVSAAQSKDDPMVSGVVVGRDTPADALPANGRDVHALFALMPGATITPASLTNGGQFTVSGQRPNANSFRVDGVSGNVGIGIISVPGSFPGGSLPAMTTIGGTETLASKEETERVELRSADFAAQYGDRPGAQIDIYTRSGTNDYHASVFGYLRPQALDSTDWFARGAAADLPAASVNGWGGSVGGPLWRGHTYFFAAYEKTDVHDSALQLIPVANEALRQQNTPYQAILNAFPAPTGRALTATESVGYSPLQKAAGADNASVRIDQTIGQHVQLFARYSYVPSVSTSIELGTAYSKFDWMSATGGFNAVFGKFTDEGRFNFSKVVASAIHGPSDTPDLDSVVNSLEQAFYRQFESDDPGYNLSLSSFTLPIAQLSVGGMGQTVTGQAAVNGQVQYDASDVLAWHSRHHDIRVGAEYDNLSTTNGILDSSIAIAASSIDALLAGVPLGVSESIYFGPSSNADRWSSFIQDTLHLSERLDLEIGTRWEFTPSAFSGYANNAGYENVASWPGAGGAINPIGYPAGLDSSLWPKRFSQFAPRIGVAYHLHHPDLVLRAGAGIFYDTQMGSIVANENPLNAWQYAPVSINPPSDLNYYYGGSRPTVFLPRVLEWRTTLEKSLGENSALSLSYVGSAGRRLLRNEATVNPRNDVLEGLAFTSNGRSSYEAMLAQYRANFTSHFYGLVSYTWSHSIDNGSSDTEPFLITPGLANLEDKGASTFDVRHVLTASLGYSTRRYLHPLLRDWNFSSTLTARSGFPFDVTTVDRSAGLGFDNSGQADLVVGEPVWISNSSVPGGRELNPAAFTVPTSGQNGSLGRDALTGPALFQIDMSLRRQFRVYRGVAMETSVSAFNVLNHPAFSSPVSYLGSALFGQSTSTANLMLGSGSPTTGLTPLYQAGGPRTIELGLRFTF